MLLTGLFNRSLDEKFRLAVPKNLRDAFVTKGEKAEGYVAPGTDGSVAVYTEEGFQRLSERLAKSSPAGQDVRAFSRLFFSKAEHVELDAQGRIRLPAGLVKEAELKHEVVLLGVRDHLEIWNLERWDEYVKKQQESYDELAERAFGPDN